MTPRRPVREPAQAQAPAPVRDPAAPVAQLPPVAPLGAETTLRLQRTVGNAAVARLVADERAASRPPVAAPPPTHARLQRESYGVVPALEAADKTVQWWDPAAKARKPVWTAEGGYTKNPSATMLKDTIGKNGRIGGTFSNGTFIYAVDQNGEVVIGKRMGQPGNDPDRARGMPHPTLIGGKKPTVLAAGEVEIRGGKIFRIDNQSGHFLPKRKSLSITLKSFLRLPASAFHPDFKTESVHYDAANVRTTKPFRSLRTLKLKARDLKQSLRGLKPRAIVGKLKGFWKGRFGPGAKGVGGSIAGLLIVLALNYFIGKWLEEQLNDFIKKQIEELAPEVEQALLDKEDELEALLEEDSEADIYMNVRFALSSDSTFVAGPGPEPEEITTWPEVTLHSVGFSRQPWDPKPIFKWQQNCGSRTETTIVTASEAIKPDEIFADEQPAGTAGAK
jgi:hypothetical protein